jgi:pentapeptide repeat protein
VWIITRAWQILTGLWQWLMGPIKAREEAQKATLTAYKEAAAKAAEELFARGGAMKDESPGISRDLQQGAWTRFRLRRLGLARGALQRPTEVWHTLPLELKAVLLLFGAGLLLLIIIEVPRWQAASWEGIAERKDLPKLENDARTTLIQALGGAALLIGLFFTWRNLRMTEQNSRQTLDLSRKGQINDRFTKAIEQLGAVDQGGRKRLEVRLGGIYALEQIAKDSPDDHHWPIMEVLTAYVRENALWEEEEQPSREQRSPSETQPMQSNQVPPTLAPDIQAILTVLGRRTRLFGKGEDQHLNLACTALRGADLRGAHLEGAWLESAHLERAMLLGAHLERASLADAHLEGVVLESAHLERAWLAGAHLERAWLAGAHLEGAWLESAHLEGAWLGDAHLEGATGLTVEQLATVKILERAQLDPPLREQIERLYPHLLEKPQDEARIS